jgi:uncharacterized membrane protein YccC
MRLTARKTWSQQELAVKLRMHPKADQGFFNFERRHTLILAAKTALAATLSWWVAKLFGVRDGYWGAISAIIVLQSNVGATVTASRDRVIGTLIGAALGFAFSPVKPLLAGYVLALLAAMIICGLMGLKNSSRLAGVTVTIVMLVHHEGSAMGLALDRVIEVLLGIVVALAVTTLVVPDRARIRLRDGLAQEFLLLGAFFEAILHGFRGAPAENLQSLRDDAQAMRRGNEQLLDATRNEPSSAGWPEGLNMLSQFARSLFEALVALELAVRGSHDDAYAQRLEPELGKLAADIRSGFNHAANCIHNWRFDASPPGYSLEQDVANLEARMESVRGTGLSFSQAEIFRAYAVQLHLKQIAQILRASRVETSRAVGQTHK